MESVLGRNWSQRIPWYPSRHLAQEKGKELASSQAAPQEKKRKESAKSTERRRRKWRKTNIFSPLSATPWPFSAWGRMTHGASAAGHGNITQQGNNDELKLQNQSLKSFWYANPAWLTLPVCPTDFLTFRSTNQPTNQTLTWPETFQVTVSTPHVAKPPFPHPWLPPHALSSLHLPEIPQSPPSEAPRPTPTWAERTIPSTWSRESDQGHIKLVPESWLTHQSVWTVTACLSSPPSDFQFITAAAVGGEGGGARGLTGNIFVGMLGGWQPVL